MLGARPLPASWGRPSRFGWRRSSSPLLLLLLVGGAALEGCGGAESAPTMQLDRVVDSLLHSDELEVRREAPGEPVTTGSIAPRVKSEGDTGPLPALVMTPPAEVALRVPASGPGAVLRLAAGLDASAYTQEGVPSVRFEVEYKGRLVLDEVRAAGLSESREDLSWRRLELPVGAGGELVLRTSLPGDVDPERPAPRAGFGLLEISVPDVRARANATTAQPNVVLICIDTLRADRLSAHGSAESGTSPTLDALAARGTLFERAYSATPWTWPSTASLLTSLAPPEHGLLDVDSCYLAHQLETLAEAFWEAGAATAAFSCNPLVAANKNFDQGFQQFTEYEWADTDVVLRDVEPWLRDAAEHRFFLYLHVTEPHRPYAPDEDLAERFAGAAPEGYSDSACKPFLDARGVGQRYDEARLAELLRHRLGLYDGEIASVDRQFARLLELLAELGVDDRTVVAVTSDHGEEFAEHGMLGHGKQLHDESLHVPLILAGPGVPVGVRVSEPVENRFVGPTLLALAGIDARRNLSGVDLLDRAAVAARAEETMFFTVQRGQGVDPERGGRFPLPELQAAQRGSWRVMWSEQGGLDRSEWTALYDLEADPQARRNVAGEHPELARELVGEIRAWLERGERVRPRALDGGEAAQGMLQEIGYIDED